MPVQQPRSDADKTPAPVRLELHSTRRDGRTLASLQIDRDYVLGRDGSSDLVLDLEELRPRHARLSRDPRGVAIEPLSGAPVVLNGDRVAGRTLLQDGDWLSLGGSPFRVELQRPAQVGPVESASSATVPLDRAAPLVFGRLPSCGIQIDSPLVSREHARVTYGSSGALLEDLGSTNGTFVNGARLSRITPLHPDDQVGIASFVFVFTGDPGHPFLAGDHGRVRIEVQGLVKEVRDRQTGQPKQLLRDINLVIEPGEFVALFGTSGSGKSTLLDALSGRRPASRGQVTYNGSDLYRDFDQFRAAIGYVPQQDIVHRKISVGRALDFTAQLRLPPDTADEERDGHVARVLKQVGLADKASLAVDTPEPLSGGQLKRVSLAVELVANPNILFLDEVTSGLDAGTDRRMMELFRSLAREAGKTVVCVTHTLENIDACHLIVLLHGGQLAYFGPPNLAEQYFGIDRLAEVYDLLETRTPDDWAARYRGSPLYVRYIQERMRHPDAGEQLAAPPAPAKRTRRRWFDGRQMSTLLRRYLALLMADGRNLAILFLQAPLIGLVIGLVLDPGVQEGPARAAMFSQVSFILMLSAIWFGCLNSAREVVKELPIYLRERSINLGIGPYLASKLLPLAVLALVQCLLMLGIVTWLTGLPGQFGQRLAVLWGATLAATTMGLTISTLVNSNDKAIAMVPILLIPQVILSGAVVELGKASEWVAKGSMISYWAFDAMKAAFDQATLDLIGPTGQPVIKVAGSLPAGLGAIAAFGLVFLMTAVIGLKMKDRRL